MDNVAAPDRMLTLTLIALVCGSFLIISFLVFARSQTENRLANQWLSLFLLCIGLLLFEDCLSRSGAYDRFPHLFGAFDLVVFSLAPCLYLSIRHFVTPDARFARTAFLNFLPSLLFVLLNSSSYFLSTEAKQQFIRQNLADTGANTVYSLAFIGVLFGQCMIYWVLSYRKLLVHQDNIRQVSASVEPVNLRWLRNVLVGVLLLIGFWMAEGVLNTHISTQLATVGYLFGAYYIGYYAVQQKTIYPYRPEEIQALTEVIDQKTLRTPPDVELLKGKLTELMTTQKLYLDSDLNLLRLAETMHLSTHDLSALINNGFGVNFYQYVNAYRIEESKKLLKNSKYDHLSMVGIAFEAGFNSKTVFNTTFKAATGLSPTDYRKSSR